MLTRSCISALLLITGVSVAAEGDRADVSLRLNKDEPQPVIGVAIGSGGQAPGGVTVKSEALPSGGYKLRITAGEKELIAVVTESQPALIDLALPYKIKLDSSTTPAALDWFPRYRAEGTLQAGGCRALIVLMDGNADGVFEKEDLRAVTSAAVDLNGNGTTPEAGEFLFGGQVFQFCGKSYFVDPDSVARDGTRLRVVETSIEVPRLGAPLPPVALETMDGRKLRPEDWRGKTVVLDFWASWCVHCIVNFPVLEQLRRTMPGVEVIGINIDEPETAAAARKLLAERKLPWPQVLLAKGLTDPIWQMFRSIGGGHGAPYYVVIDPDGLLRYAGSGGTELRELQEVVRVRTRASR
jgi:thiol-disulfide isomerase/thioredoxin